MRQKFNGAPVYFYLSIGSNIKPEQNAVNIVKLLIKKIGAIKIYPFVYTVPEELDSQAIFLNSLAIVFFQGDKDTLKTHLNSIETTLGRNRLDPDRSTKDRAADIDILYQSVEHEPQLFLKSDKFYVRAPFVSKENIADLQQFGLPSIQRATAVDLDVCTGNIVIVDQTDDRFVDR